MISDESTDKRLSDGGNNAKGKHWLNTLERIALATCRNKEYSHLLISLFGHHPPPCGDCPRSQVFSLGNVPMDTCNQEESQRVPLLSYINPRDFAFLWAILIIRTQNWILRLVQGSEKKCEDWYWLKPATKIWMTYLHDNHDNDDHDMGDLQSGLPTAALCSALQLATLLPLLHSYLPFWSFAELVGGDMMRYAMQKSAVE